MLKRKIGIAWWGFGLAWKKDKKMLLFWGMLSAVIAVFPALILACYERVLSGISGFLATGLGSFADVAGHIVLLGCFFVISGLSARLNKDFLYWTMYDSFYLGFEEVVMDASQRLEISEFAKKKTADEFYAAHRRSGALNDITSAGCALLGSLVSIISILIVACSVSPFVCAAAAAYVALVLFVNVRMADKCRVVFKDIDMCRRKADYVRKLAQEGDTAKEVRIFRNLDLLKAQWREAIGGADRMTMRQAKAYAIINLTCQCGFYGFLGVIMGFALYQVGRGTLGADRLLMLFTLGINLSEAVSSVPDCYQRFDYGLYGLGLLKDFLDKAPFISEADEKDKHDTPLDDEICFEADHLSFAYPGGQPVLRDISFQIKNGETVALVGVNGSGKSTLLKLMMGLYKAEPGMLKFQGREYGEYKHEHFQKKIGAFFQDFFVFHLTVKENVGIGNVACMDNEQMIWDALEKGGVAKLVSSWKKGIDQRLNKEIYTDGMALSGGETQRMAVARTHMSDKEILIFDEPASMLDPIAELEQFNHIRSKIQGHTAILVSHRIGFARLADRIIVLNKGRLEESGTHEDLLAKGGLYAQLFHEQAQWYDLSGSAKEVR